MLFVVLLAAGVTGNLEPTTTKTYDIDTGSKTIRIIEGEPLWQTTPKTQFEHRAFNVRSSTVSPLDQFLAKYADTVRNKNKENQDEFVLNDSTEKGKSWDSMQYQKHNHPYDDKKGWVSMEPIPWSISKISKWQSKYKSSTPQPWEEYDEEPQSVRPSWNKQPTTNYENYFIEKKPEPKPIFPKPSALYNQKVHVDYANRYQHKHDKNCNHPQSTDDEIITDGLPANFPQQYEASRRHGTEMHPDTHPFSESEGEWVLLSTTKGYKYPHQRQRAMKIDADSIGTRRGVRLTVLPPLKNSKVNMTTSHGGLLQVESSFQTVEQARKQYNKKQKQKQKKKPQKNKNRPKPKPAQQVVAQQVAGQQVAVPGVTTTTRRNSGPDSSALLAAVGAGMIPATMAMLVPMALGGRKKREVSSTEYYQVTLPRNLY